MGSCLCRLRFLRRVLAVVGACAWTGTCASGQGFEFAGAELRGRIDQPSVDNVWTVGDNNGNGVVDEEERFGTRVNVAEALLESPGSTFETYGPTYVLLPSSPTLMFGFIDVIDSVGGPFRPDGSADDIDGNGQFGPDGYDMEDPGRVPDVIFDPGFYFDNVVFLPPTIAFLGRDAYARYGGAQLMHVVRFQGDPEFTLTAASESVELGYGMRYLSSWQDYHLQGRGGVMGQLLVDSTLESEFLGPQASVRWAVQNGRWRAHAEAAAAVTYMDLEAQPFAQMGEERPAPIYNRGLYWEPSATNSALSEWDVAPVLEAGVLASYDFTPATLGFVRCDAIQFGNVREIERATVYQLPRMGLRDPGGRDVTITSASIGIEIRR